MKDESKSASGVSLKRKTKLKKPLKVPHKATPILSKSQSSSKEKVPSQHRKKLTEQQLQSNKQAAEKFVSFGQSVKPEEAR